MRQWMIDLLNELARLERLQRQRAQLRRQLWANIERAQAGAVLKTRPNKERRPVPNLPAGLQRVCCKLGTFRAHLDTSPRMHDRALAVVRKWAGPLFKGASFSVVHAGGTVIVSYQDLEMMYGLRAGPVRQLIPAPTAFQPKVIKGGKTKKAVPPVSCSVPARTIDAEIVEIAAKQAAQLRAPAPAAAKTVIVADAPKARPAWLAMARFRAVPRDVARMPAKAVQS